VKLDRAGSGLTLLRNLRLVCEEPQATILLVRRLYRPKPSINKGWRYLEYNPSLSLIQPRRPFVVTVA
jgi:3-deoxy-D-arabino-heptulosonate 7-phosphate (DAHP) synthase